MGAYWSRGYYYGHHPFAFSYYPYHYAPAYPLFYYVGERDARHIEEPGSFLTTHDGGKNAAELMDRFISNVHKYQNTRRLKKTRREKLSQIRSDVMYSAERLGRALGHADGDEEQSAAVMASHAMLMIDYTEKKTAGKDVRREESMVFGEDRDRVTNLLGESHGIHSNAWLEYLNCSTKGLSDSRKQRIQDQKKAAQACVNLVTDTYM